MKRTLLVLVFPLLLGGCAQVFDGNLFGSVDQPPPLNLSKLSSASPSEIQNMMQDESFVEQLKENPDALKAVQDALTKAADDTSASAADRVEAGTTLVELTAQASGVAEMKNDAVKNISTISDAISQGKYSLALKIFMGSQTEAEITVTLTNLQKMAASLATMQNLAKKADDTLDATVFYSGTTDRGSFSQSALMAAIASALIQDSTGGDVAAKIASLAADLSQTAPTTGNGGPDMVAFLAAKGADKTTFTVTAGKSTASPFYSYTYVALLIPELPLGL